MNIPFRRGSIKGTEDYEDVLAIEESDEMEMEIEQKPNVPVMVKNSSFKISIDAAPTEIPVDTRKKSDRRKKSSRVK